MNLPLFLFKVIFVIFVFYDRADANPVELNLQMVTEKARTADYKVQAKAERLYQSRMAMVKARTDLLPSINLWRLLSNVNGFQLEWLQDIAPFLIPANWFRKTENKYLHKAEMFGYQTLVANEIMNARSQYWHLIHDQQIISLLKLHLEEMDQIIGAVRVRESSGIVPVGSSRELTIRYLAMKDEWNKIRSLLQREILSFTLGLGLPAANYTLSSSEEMIAPLRFQLPDFELTEGRALALAPELKQFNYLLKVIPHLKSEVYFAILGAGKASRGLPGNPFDSIPTLDGWSFSVAPVLKTIESQKRLIVIQRDGVRETIKRQWLSVYSDLEIGLERQTDLVQRISLTREAKTDLIQQIQLGEKANIMEMLDLSRSLVEAEITAVALHFQLRTALDLCDRLQFKGAYFGLAD